MKTTNCKRNKIIKRNSKYGKRLNFDIYLKIIGNTTTKSLEKDIINADISLKKESSDKIKELVNQ